MNECSNDKIMNPTTGRCVLKTGKIGIEILKIHKSKKSKKSHKKMVECSNDKIMNPKTGRCVSKTGKIGLEILKTQKPHKPQKKMSECSDDKIINPKTGKCVLKTGKIGVEILGQQSKVGSLKKKIENSIIKSEWFIITKNSCTFCAKAKSILIQNNKKFSELETTDSNIIYNVTDRYTSNYHYFPMIFNNGKFIGGFEELDKLKLNSIPSTPYMKSPLHIIKPKYYDETTFGGFASDAFNAMLYLKYKYPDDCIVMADDKRTRNYHIWSDFALGMFEKQKKGIDFFIPSFFWESVQKCIDNGAIFIVMPFIFRCDPPPYHANYLVYNSKTKEMERFEPNGFISLDCVNPPNLDSKIQDLFNKNIGKDMIKKMYSPLDFCPYLGFQRIQYAEGQQKSTDPGGFCLAWATWYADIRMANPNKTQKQVIQMALDRMKFSPESFTTFIRSYAEFTIQKKL